MRAVDDLQRAGDVLGGNHVQELVQDLREPVAQPRKHTEHGVDLGRSSQCTRARTGHVDKRADCLRRRISALEQSIAPNLDYESRRSSVPPVEVRVILPVEFTRMRTSLRHAVTVGPTDVDAIVRSRFCGRRGLPPDASAPSAGAFTFRRKAVGRA